LISITAATTLTEAARGATLEIDLAAIVANWRDLVGRHAGPVAGVLKADAYGLGASRVGPVLHAAGCRHFFVALLDEALALRPLLPGAMIAVLNGVIPGTEPIYAAQDITPVLASLDDIERWRPYAAQPAILHIDTGMSRLGLDRRELDILASEPRRLDGMVLRYVMTHLVSAELPDDPMNRQQHQRFSAARMRLAAAPFSLANSSGIFLGADFASDLARPGAALYGLNPTPHLANPMRCTVRLTARVIQVRDVVAGDSVGYNATWIAERPSRIATVGVGYADGWARALSSRGHALFDGAPVPLVGRVSMDLMTFDVTDHPRLTAGQSLELLGPGLPPDDVARDANTNGYNILTALGRRYHRVYRA
jgi:alanine racemase